MSKMIVIDGSSMLVTGYYGTLPRSIMFAKTQEEKEAHYSEIMHAPDGTYTNAVFVMMKMLMKIIKEQKPDYLAVCFDKSRNTFRRNIYPSYKANRSDTPEPLKKQFVLMETILEYIGVQTLYSDEFEADDLAGSVIERFKSNVDDVYFITKDHDYLQLIDKNVHALMVQPSNDKAAELWNKYYKNCDPFAFNWPDKAIEFTDDVILAEEGVHGYQIADLKGIAGDASDNIPGVKGVKSAAAPLLIEYGTVEGIYKAIEACNGDTKAEKALVEHWKELGITRSPLKALKENKSMAIMSKDLATIRRNAPVPEDLTTYITNINPNNLTSMLVKYNMRSLM